MEKIVPHFPLIRVKALVNAGNVISTRSELNGAAALGLDFNDMLEIILDLQMGDFYKSMTTFADHTIWQDVHHYASDVGDIYLKLSVVDDLLIVSFKEK